MAWAWSHFPREEPRPATSLGAFRSFTQTLLDPGLNCETRLLMQAENLLTCSDVFESLLGFREETWGGRWGQGSRGCLPLIPPPRNRVLPEGSLGEADGCQPLLRPAVPKNTKGSHAAFSLISFSSSLFISLRLLHLRVEIKASPAKQEGQSLDAATVTETGGSAFRPLSYVLTWSSAWPHSAQRKDCPPILRENRPSPPNPDVRREGSHTRTRAMRASPAAAAEPLGGRGACPGPPSSALPPPRERGAKL